MDVEVNLSEDDLNALGAYILRREEEFRRERVRRAALRFAIVLGFAVLAVFLFQTEGAPESALKVVGTCVVLMSLYLAGVYFVGGMSATRRVNRIIGSKEMEEAERRRYILTDEGITYQGPGGSGKASWKDIAEIADTDEHILVFPRAQHPYVLPRRAFRSEQETVQFLRLARDYHAQQ